ncbi:CheR family methyltransferase [Negadavirga shengliensis]|uniref:CheR family methyltransferase n=1 Tax=Negadavirga shengliensis TaxID=1389218 RepID=A0ABV9T123_9BACT
MIIIAIGASAGGLEPLEIFFKNLNPIPNAAFVIIQHLAPHHKSLMDQLLKKHTLLPIEIIEDDKPIKEGVLYLNPPNKIVHLGKNLHFKLEDKPAKGLSFPISSFFESVIAHGNNDVIGIILSGTGSDGSDGMKRIKEGGGFTMVQNPDEAKFDGMPKNAIYTGAVDMILPVKKLAAKTIKLVKGIETVPHKKHHKKEAFFNEILTVLQQRTGIDFKTYKESTVLRRIERRMSILGIRSFSEYCEHLIRSADEANLLCNDLFIGVTRFFRDEKAFEILQKEVIPKICEKENPTEPIRIWVPACSTGEEVYSIAILVHEYLMEKKIANPVVIFGTDIDRKAVKIAGMGIYNAGILKELDSEKLKKFFVSLPDGKLRISKKIRESIVFSVHNVLDDPPFSKIDLISCRNFLIYLKSEIQQKIYTYFRYSLKHGGFLFLGNSESLGNMQENFIEVDRKWKVFLNKQSTPLPEVPAIKRNSKRISNRLPTMENMNQVVQIQKKKISKEKLNSTLIQKYVPDSVICDQKFSILHTVGPVLELFNFPPGEFTYNLLDIVPDNLRYTLDVSSNKVLQHAGHIKIPGVKFESKDEGELYTLKLRPLKLPHDDESLLMVEIIKNKEDNGTTANDSDQIEIKRLDLDKDTIYKIQELEEVVKSTREDLQNTIEELEASNEELQSTNEELQSSNEELESVNEELYTVNAEYQEKVEELSLLNDDLNNLLNSSDIAILFLDENLYIRRHTKSIRKILNITDGDIGRPITDFATTISTEDIINNINEVRENLSSKEVVVKGAGGHVYILKITPFRTYKNKIKGIVLSFFDITEIKSNQKQLEELEETLLTARKKISEQEDLFRMIALHSSDFISILDMNNTYEYVSPSCKELTGCLEEQLIKKDFFERVHEEDMEKLLDYFELAKANKASHPIRYRYKDVNRNHKWLESNIKCITDSNGKAIKLLITSRDITSTVAYQEELDLLSNIVRESENSVILTDTEGKITWVNESFGKRTGYSLEECIGEIPDDLLHGDETDPHVVEVMAEGIRQKKGYDVEVVYYTKKKEKFWVRVQCQPFYNNTKELKGFFALQSDISFRKEMDERFLRINRQLEEKNIQLGIINNELRQFAHMASHDLKEPVRGITSIIDLIKEDYGDKLDEEGKMILDMAIESGNRMLHLINGLLDYSKTGEIKEELKVVDLDHIINVAVGNLKVIIEENYAEFNISSIPKIIGYEQLLVRLFQNLFSNAIKYRRQSRPLIEVNSNETEHHYQIKVKDNGKGIKREDMPKLFKVFSRLTNHSKVEGSGLGLYICKQIMEQHGGEIGVESTFNSGTTFVLTFPKVKQ